MALPVAPALGSPGAEGEVHGAQLTGIFAVRSGLTPHVPDIPLRRFLGIRHREVDVMVSGLRPAGDVGDTDEDPQQER